MELIIKNGYKVRKGIFNKRRIGVKINYITYPISLFYTELVI